MLNYGYGGKVLRIDLSSRTYKSEELQKSWIKDVIGGRAANSKRLLEEIDPQCDPLGPNNILIFGIGPLTGSILQHILLFQQNHHSQVFSAIQLLADSLGQK
ncbi:aldehyde ferredoxin oxidoreductase N-terminal domain-containing protein [Bacteroidota bacterium]